MARICTQNHRENGVCATMRNTYKPRKRSSTMLMREWCPSTLGRVRHEILTLVLFIVLVYVPDMYPKQKELVIMIMHCIGGPKMKFDHPNPRLVCFLPGGHVS